MGPPHVAAFQAVLRKELDRALGDADAAAAAGRRPLTPLHPTHHAHHEGEKDTLKGKKILVTGGTGQVAGPVAETLADAQRGLVPGPVRRPGRRAELNAPSASPPATGT